MVANPGGVALICVAAGALPFDCFDINTDQYIADWATYEADTTLVVASHDDLTGGIPCEGDHWMLVWLPDDPTSAGTLPDDNEVLDKPKPRVYGTGCGKLLTIRRLK